MSDSREAVTSRQNTPDSVYADQWKACADLLRTKAAEFDELARTAPIRPKVSTEVGRAIVDARSFIDLTKGSNFPDEFVRDMSKCLKRCLDLLEGMLR